MIWGATVEYSLARAHEIRRLDYEQQISLHVQENNRGRAMYPHEIQERFSLPPLKATYMIPEIDNAQSSHSQRVSGDFYREGIYPKYLHLGTLDVESCHEFDKIVSEKPLDFVYSGGTKRKSLRDEVNE